MESPGWSQGLNRYSYVFNNPLNAVDPTGFMERHEHPEDDDVSVSEILDPATGVPTFEQPPIGEGDRRVNRRRRGVPERQRRR